MSETFDPIKFFDENMAVEQQDRNASKRRSQARADEEMRAMSPLIQALRDLAESRRLITYSIPSDPRPTQPVRIAVTTDLNYGTVSAWIWLCDRGRHAPIVISCYYIPVDKKFTVQIRPHVHRPNNPDSRNNYYDTFHSDWQDAYREIVLNMIPYVATADSA